MKLDCVYDALRFFHETKSQKKVLVVALGIGGDDVCLEGCSVYVTEKFRDGTPTMHLTNEDGVTFFVSPSEVRWIAVNPRRDEELCDA